MTTADKIAAIDKLIGLYERETDPWGWSTTDPWGWSTTYPYICPDLGKITGIDAIKIPIVFDMLMFKPTNVGVDKPWFPLGDFTSRIELLKKMKTNLLNK